ncbi:MAG: hypothetical protein ACD_39C01075G0001 [uncultured bacterium]|nr:MAG: hypothetical protein ACD_39C01075G0001 [uncultured bacterium]
MKPCVTIPGLIDNYLDLALVRFLYDIGDVIDQAVIRAVGKNKNLELLSGRQCMIHCGYNSMLGNRAKDAVAIIDRWGEIERFGARKNGSVMHRFMTVAIKQYRVARRQ